MTTFCRDRIVPMTSKYLWKGNSSLIPNVCAYEGEGGEGVKNSKSHAYVVYERVVQAYSLLVFVCYNH